MITDTDRAYLESLQADIDATDTRLMKLAADRDDAIRLALEVGAKPTELGLIFRLTRERIYQIKDRRR